MNDDDLRDGADLSVQPALPSLELPTFEGILPVGVVNRLNGAGERISRAMGFGERAVLLVEAEVTNVGHGKTAQGMKRIHTLSVLDLYELEGKPGRRILTAARQSYKIADDQRHGKVDLLREHAAGAGWKLTPDGYVDASGRLLDEDELAEIRGGHFERAANDPRLDPVALVYVDGSRAMWPDDFPDAGDGPPAAGDFFGDLQVVEVLDGVTGETLATWTPEQEDARLAALEDAARVEEARADAEAFAELQAGRGLAPDGSPLGRPCDECKEPVPSLDEWQMVVEGGAGVVRGHRSCIDAEWGPGTAETPLEQVPADDPFVGLPGPDGPIQPKVVDLVANLERSLDAAKAASAEPLPGYEKMTARDVITELAVMTDRDAVFALAEWEEAHGGRKTVMDACGRRTAELLGSEQ